MSTFLLVAGLFSLILQPISNAQTTENTKPGKIPCRGRSLEYLVVERVFPDWPPERGMHIKGNVVVKITIDEKGDIVSARAICGHPLKMSCAVSAVRKWEFHAYVTKGKAKKISGIVTVPFLPEVVEEMSNEVTAYGRYSDKPFH